MNPLSLKSIILLSTFLLMLKTAQSYEEPEYHIIEKINQIEIREYKGFIKAEVKVNGGFDEAGNSAFRKLFKYITGNNHTSENKKISKKIPMTVPVLQEPSDLSYHFSFVMPKTFTLNSLPTPNDKSIKLKEVKKTTFAVLSYSGTWSEDNYREAENKLLLTLKKSRIQTIGKPIFARYNSPFSIWFLRRNEVLIEIKKKL